MPYAKNHKAKSKDRILSSAIELFARYGFERVSIGEIMNQAKLTHGAFYSHFESKEALFKASFMETIKRSRAAKLMKGPLSLKHLTELVSNYWNLRELETKIAPGPEVVLFNEVHSKNTDIKKLFETSYFDLKKMIEVRLIALGKIKKVTVPSDKELISEKARIILSVLIGAVALAKTLPCGSSEASTNESESILKAAQKQILNLIGLPQDELLY